MRQPLFLAANWYVCAEKGFTGTPQPVIIEISIVVEREMRVMINEELAKLTIEEFSRVQR